jgi:hypothetical protein
MRHKLLSIHTHYGLYAAHLFIRSCVRPSHVDVDDDDETSFAGWRWLADVINGYVTLCVKARWERLAIAATSWPCEGNVLGAA